MFALNVMLSRLPSEILLDIFKKCKVCDIHQISLTCKAFWTLTQDDTLWLTFCQRVFPTLDFRNNSTTFQSTYQDQVSRYSGLPGIYTSGTANMLVTVIDNQIRGRYLNFYVEGFGRAPVALFRNKLEITWDAEAQSWDPPRSSIVSGYPDQWRTVKVAVEQGALMVKHKNPIPLKREFARTTVPILREQAHLRHIIQPGIFVESSATLVTSLTKLYYPEDGDEKVMKIEKVKRMHSMDNIQFYVTEVLLTEVTNLETFGSEPSVADITYYLNGVKEIPLEDKMLPPPFIERFCSGMEFVDKISATYRVAFECMQATAKHPSTFVSQEVTGFCLIFNDNVFGLYSYDYETFKIFFRVDAISALALVPLGLF